jgi:Putative peptidoglycan binding domain
MLSRVMKAACIWGMFDKMRAGVVQRREHSVAAAPTHRMSTGLGGASRVLAMQRTMGNAAVAHMIAAARRTEFPGHVGAPSMRTSRGVVLARQSFDPQETSPFQGDKRIEQARRNRPAIKFGEVSPGVRKVQQRLADVGFEPAFSRRSDGTFDGGFGKGTRDAVKDFQANAEIAVDGEVGHDTISKLEQPDGGLPPTPIPPTTKVDVIVKFQGALGSDKALAPSAIFPDRLLTTYSAKPGRRLVRLGQTTTTIRDQSDALLKDHVAKIKAAFVGNDQGKVFIYGSSSGGRNALDLAIRLTNQSIPIAIVAALDAAWFPDEATNSPTNLVGAPNVIPQFDASGAVSADQKESFFQTKGNHVAFTRRGKTFSSNMAFGEIHGNISTFGSKDLSAKVTDPVSDDDAHIKLIIAATPVVQAEIRTILDSL